MTGYENFLVVNTSEINSGRTDSVESLPQDMTGTIRDWVRRAKKMKNERDHYKSDSKSKGKKLYLHTFANTVCANENDATMTQERVTQINSCLPSNRRIVVDGDGTLLLRLGRLQETNNDIYGTVPNVAPGADGTTDDPPPRHGSNNSSTVAPGADPSAAADKK